MQIKMFWLRSIQTTFFVLFPLLTFSQNRIFGIAQQAPYSNILLVDASDTTQVASTFANDSGYYEFRRVSKGTYFIQVSAMGFHRTNSSPFEVTSSSDNINIPNIALTPSSEQLDVVVVEAHKPVLELEAGKIIMNISEGIIAKSDNVFEMLRKFPGVSIDINDNISLNGKSGVLVTINDRETHLSGQDLAHYLRSMPGSSVQKIEAIEQPSAKYDAQGSGGIINIVTIKNFKQNGFSGSVNTALRVSERGVLSPNAGVSLNYQTKNAVFFGLLNYYGGGQRNSYEGITKYEDGTLYKSNQNEDEKWGQRSKHHVFFGKFGADIYLSKKDVISLSYDGVGGTGSSNSAIYTDISRNDTLLKKVIQNATGSQTRQNHNANFNYEHTFDSILQNKLTLDFSWTGGINKSGTENNVSYHFPLPEQPDQYIYYENSQPVSSNIYALKLDYEHPFKNKQTKLETGIKASWVKNDNEQEYIQDNVLDDENSFNYLYNEIIGAAYIQVRHTFKTKTSIEAGLRGEFTFNNGHTERMILADTALSFKNFYIRPFPSITVSQEIDSKNKLNLSYRYRLTRPYFGQLNPFRFREKVSTYREGNPFLKPEYAHSVQLQYSYGYFLNFKLSYERLDGTSGDLTYLNKNTSDPTLPGYYSLTRPENIGKSDMLSLSFFTRQSFFKNRFSWTVFANGYYNWKDIVYLNDLYKTKGFGGFVWTQLEMDFGKDWSGEISYWGMFPSKSLFSDTRYIGGLSTGIKKIFLKKTLTVTLSFDNIIPINYSSATSNPNGTYSSAVYKWDAFTVSLDVSYRFGNNKVTKAQRQIAKDEEAARIGGGGGSGSGGVGGGAPGGGR
ncbi:MAG: outer membrane beta-barrel protein [Bacteroidales bacterium]|jgi:hypothetical protein|nr:outer membrane beta-barrel protein [Bacteroidales bacterium]